MIASFWLVKPTYAAPKFTTFDEVNVLITEAIASLNTQVQDILTRLSSVEAQLGELEPVQPLDFIFFDNLSVTESVFSDVVDVQDYAQGTISYYCTHPSNLIDFHLQVSENQSVWNNQQIIDCEQGTTYTFNVAGRYYRIMAHYMYDGSPITLNVFGHFTN